MPAARLRPFLWGWAAYAAVYFAFGFHPGVVASDDFGYLRSVLGTLQAHRPYVYDWLEPYAAAFSSACALLYAVTGRFQLSTWGFQALCALAFYPLLARLLAARLRPAPAAWLALATALLPPYFAKAADFHAAYLTLDLALAAWLAFEARRWGWFFLAAFLAFANRQNQIALLALPWAYALGEARAGRPVTRAIPLGTAVWAAAAALLAASLNRAYAAAHAAYRHEPLAELARQAALALAAGGYLALGCLAVASLLAGRPPAWRGLFPGSGPRPASSSLPARLLPFLAAAGLLALIPSWGPSLLRIDTPLFGMFGWAEANRVLPWILLALLPALDPGLLRRTPYAALAAAYVGIAAVRGVWWDYYFLEIALLALLAALDGAPRPSLPRPSSVFLAFLLCAELGYAYLYKVQSDKQRLAVEVLERLEREGRVATEAMTGATFGHLGWKLFDYYVAHDGRDGGELQDFLGYVRLDRVRIETGLPWRRGYKEALPAGADSLGGGECRIGFATVPYRVIDLHGPRSGLPALGPLLRLEPGFRAPRYPLDDAEWDAWIRSGGRR